VKSYERINASDYLELVENIYLDASTKCSADVFDFRDLETIKSRVKNEGISFLTITLPQYAKDFERSLALGNIDSALFRNFKKNGSIPAFLQGMISQIFDRKTGKVIPYEPPNGKRPLDGVADDIPTVVEAIRQICRCFSKVELECTPQRVQAAIDNFYEIEQDFRTFSVPVEDTAKFLAVSHLLWDNMVRDFDPSLIVPKHGPGTTAERILGNQKYVWRRWHDRLEPYFPLLGNAYPTGLDANSEELEIVSIVTEDDEQPVRVVTVPKTLKSPRVIAIEPACMQYVQQGIRDYLYDKIETYWLTRERINFRKQSFNQRMALTGSRTGRLATIDLSEASDRVPLSLAMEMFKANPDLHDSILACRSTRAHLPDGRTIGPLLKFASMGSALCFPVEAMYFYTICIVAMLESKSLSYTQRNIYNVSDCVYVYGDDIIVPSANAEIVLEYLQKYNCKVNAHKTFVSGYFRESCGVDAFAGYEVTPTYLRKLRPENKRQSDRLISWTATANLFYEKGYWKTATFMFQIIERILGPLPYVGKNSAMIGRTSFQGYEFHPKNYQFSRWNSDYQRLEIKGWVPGPVYRPDELDGWAALAKCLSTDRSDENQTVSELSLLNGEPHPDPLHLQVEKDPVSGTHLEQSAQFGAVTLKRRWAIAY